MSSNKIFLFVFLLVMAGLIAGIAFMSARPKQTAQPTALNQTTQNNPSPTNTVQTSPALIQSGTSNQQLQQDSQTIDNSLSTLNTDLNNVDSGLNDQQTNLQ